MTRISALAFLLVSSVAHAQTTVTPAPATPPPAAESDGGMGWLGLLILLAIVAAAVWYFMKRRGAATTASGVDRTSVGTTTTGTTGSPLPPTGPNVYPSKDREH
jgi:drug/metabolite transporter (DMT)-like permease